MATTTQLALPQSTANPIAMWHLMSLDAPTVAMLWTWFVARVGGIHLPAAALAAMGLAVWLLYAADRLLDARAGSADELEARHYFHRRHRRAFAIGMALAGAALFTILPRLNPEALDLYRIEGLLLAAWFLILHATSSAHRLPKEIAVGVFFSAAIFIPAIARDPNLRAQMLPDAVLFAALCSLNCLFIYAWEHEGAGMQRAHASTLFAIDHLPALASVVALAGAALTLLKPGALAAACALAAVLLLALDRHHLRFSRNTLRAAADLALLTPVLLLPFLR